MSKKHLVDLKRYESGKVVITLCQVNTDIVSYEYDDQDFNCIGQVFKNRKKALKFYNTITL